jgi:ABC-type multidrug transport system fused ATPase/permease subunit
MTAIGGFIWITTYLYFTFLVIMSERVGRKTRVAYLKAILQQDISWFDENNATELPSRLTRECATITKALGEKMGQIILSMAMCVSGLAFAFVRGWWMSLILLFVFPVLMIASMLISHAVASGFGINLKSYGQSAGYAE